MQKITVTFLSDKVLYIVGEKMEEGIELKIHIKVQRKGDKKYELMYINIPSKIGRMINLQNKVAILDPKTNCIILREKQA